MRDGGAGRPYGPDEMTMDATHEKIVGRMAATAPLTPHPSALIPARVARLPFHLPLSLALGLVFLLLAQGARAGAVSPQRLDTTRVQREVERYVEGELKESGDQWQVKRVVLTGDPRLPAGPLHLSLSRGRGVALAGTVVLHLQVEAAGGVVRHLRVNATIDRRRPVWVAAHDLRRGTVVEADSLRQEYLPWGTMARDSVVRLADAVGMQLSRSVRAGDVVRASQLKPVPVVRRGDRVTLVAHRGPLLVRARGVVREAGGHHARVRVANATSGKVVMGTVIDSATVEVAF